MQTCRPQNAPSGELHAEKAANSDDVQRCCVICPDRDLSPESCALHYFLGEYREKNLLQRGKIQRLRGRM